MIEFVFNGKKLVFTGDLGNSPSPLLKDTDPLEDVDYLVMESVYGDRNHEHRDERRKMLEEAIEDNYKRKGALIIPTFSLERSQELLFEINEFVENKRIPQMPIYFDSPLAIHLTDVYRRHQECFNETAQKLISSGDDIFTFPGLRVTLSTEESKMIVKEFSGHVPEDQLNLQKLPGVGLYTSGAVSSLAYNRPAVVLDGNINRVLMRLLAIEEDPRLKAVQVILRKLILELTQAAGASVGPRYTVLALMDLGADVCVPQKPICGTCPVAKFCLAFQYKKQDSIPAKGDEVERIRIRRLHALIPFKGKWLVGQRQTEGLFGGLWEFPGVDAKAGIEPAVLLEKRLRMEPGLRLQVMRALPPFEHILSHREFTVRGFIFESPLKASLGAKKKAAFYRRYSWVTLKRLEKMGISVVTKKLLNYLTAESE
jgi:adenine-specific DNA glycosylase